MRYSIFGLCILASFLISCGGDASSASSEGKSGAVKARNVSIPDDICGLVTKEMIFGWFDVDEAELEAEVDLSSYSPEYSKCGYTWKKENYEELTEKYMEYMMAGVTGGKVDIAEAARLESPSNSILVGGFKKYESAESAKSSFKNLHRVPSKEDLEKLKQEFDKKAETENLNERQKEIGTELGGGIAAAMKFTPVSGVGEEAFYSELDKSLDVRYGAITFKVYVDTELGHEENIVIAKEIAGTVLEKL